MSKKIITYFSLLMLLSSILVSPAATLADTMTSKDQDSAIMEATKETTDTNSFESLEMIPTSSEDKIENTEIEEPLEDETVISLPEDSSQEISIETTTSINASTSTEESEKPIMKTIPKENVRKTITSNSKAVSDVVTNIVVTDGEGKPITSVGQWNSFRINGIFSLPNGLISAGDTTVISLPSVLKFTKLTAFEIKDDKNNLVANATVNPDTKEIILTYTGYAANHSDVKGHFYFYVGIDTNVIQQPETIQSEITIDGKTYPFTIDFEGVQSNELPMSKAGWFIENSKEDLQYNLAINRIKKSFPKVVLKDSLKSHSVSYVPGSFQILKGEWIKNSSGDDWILDKAVDVTSNFTINIEKDNKSFSIDLGNVTDQDHYSVLYKARLDYVPVNGEKIDNSAALISDEVIITDALIKTEFQESGGTAGGYTFNVNILKKASSGQQLSGAEFQLIRDKTQEVVQSVTTDSAGRGSFNGLLKEDYTLKETKAPEGYKLSSQDIKISQNDFNSQQEFSVEVINEPKEIEVALNAQKMLTGKKLLPGEFQFELKDDLGNSLEKVANDEEGDVHFSKISYSKEGTYEYTITEVKGNETGILYDSHIEKVRVIISTDLSGKLQSKVVYDNPIPTFNNTYKPIETSLGFRVKKELIGKNLSKDAFSFELRNANGVVIETVKNNVQGEVVFSEVTFKEPGNFNFTINEVLGNELGITYDDKIEEVSVVVKDDNGQLRATPTYKGNRTFVNQYNPLDVRAAFKVKKELVGKKLEAGTFEFELKDAQGVVLQRLSHDANGEVIFQSPLYTQPGTYQYTINEINDQQPGIVYDTHVVKIRIVVGDYGGVLVATASHDGDLTFKNSYQPTEAKLSLSVNKNLTGKQLDKDIFEFELRDAQGVVLKTAKNDSSGKVAFSDLTYTSTGTYHYTINEVEGNEPGIIYDNHVEPVTVKVTDNGGELEAVATYDGSRAFNNKYAPSDVIAVFNIKKELTGKILEKDMFEFELKDDSGKVLQKMSHDAKGNVAFNKILYTQPGVYKYTITEVNDQQPSINYDDHIVKIKIIVEDYGGFLVSTATHEGDLVFRNSYEPEKTSIGLNVTKKLTGKNLEKDAFTFELRDENGNILQNVKNDANGQVNFNNITYTKVGTYHYSIHEVKGNELGMTYDQHQENVVIDVVEDNGQLKATVRYEGDRVFNNSYDPLDVRAAFNVKKELIGKELVSDAFQFDLKDSNGNILQRVSNDKEGNVRFDNIH